MFQVSTWLIQVHFEILRCSIENMASHLLTKYIVKAVNSPFIGILEPLHLHIVHMVSISYWSSVFSSVV